MRASRPPKSRLALAALAVAGFAVAALGGCARAGAPSGLPPGTTLEDLPEGESWGAELRTTEAGVERVALSAPYLARFRRGDTTSVFLGLPPGAPPDSTAGRVSVRLFDERGAPSATVAADRAWYHPDEQRLVAEGRVEAEVPGERGARITASRLTTSDGGAFVASGDATVDLRGADARVTARRVAGTAGGGRYEADGGVVVQTRGGRRLQAGRVVWDEAAGRFRVPGAFVFDGPGERVRGVALTATADLSHYAFRRASGEIEVRE